MSSVIHLMHVYYAALALGADDSHVCHSLWLCLSELSPGNLVSSHFSVTWNEIQVICAQFWFLSECFSESRNHI
jgi:hypothetical protein